MSHRPRSANNRRDKPLHKSLNRKGRYSGWSAKRDVAKKLRAEERMALHGISCAEDWDDDIDLPTREGMRAGPTRVASFDRKQLSDDFTQLRGVLTASVGKPWDEVFSLLLEDCPTGGDNVHRNHLIGHVHDLVTVSTGVDEDGHVYSTEDHYSAWGPDSRVYLTGPNSGQRKYAWNFFVHPVTKVLCPRGWAEPSTKKEPTLVCINDQFYHRDDRCNWTKVHVARRPIEPQIFEPERLQSSRRHCFISETKTIAPHSEYTERFGRHWPSELYAIEVVQIPTFAAKKLGLTTIP